MLDVVTDVGLEPLVSAAADFLTGTGIESTVPLVVLVGHGATVTNNPHVAAYDCGACGGQAGDVSARAMVQVLSDPRVVVGLIERGIDVSGTTFVAALHDTTRDRISILDVEVDPSTALARLVDDLDRASEAVAHERQHTLPQVSAGGGDLRPSAPPRRSGCRLGAGAAGVGPGRQRRDGHRPAVVDDRNGSGRPRLPAVLPARLDPDGALLASLWPARSSSDSGSASQYWCSTIDPERFGAGDKTTHNVVVGPEGSEHVLSGVVTGVRGDLRIGLPWQAVSSHAPHSSSDGSPDHSEEPWVTPPHHVARRLLVVVSADEALTEAALARSPQVTQLVTGAWITLCAVDPSNGVVRRRRPDGSWTDEATDDEGVTADVPLAA